LPRRLAFSGIYAVLEALRVTRTSSRTRARNFANVWLMRLRQEWKRGCCADE
jgi:hypothetical protein